MAFQSLIIDQQWKDGYVLGNQHAEIVAVITVKPETIQSGGAPVFIVEDIKHLQKMSLTLEKIMDAAAHEVEEETMIIVAR
ncbi:hypothetical protein MKY34_14110 [Sporosarcina sp. FSL K6-1522]|uniref:capping complex subunit for YIEGIA n=1 Tax=Sporosarcina sp. FSL K6-1522 TaxID=2921554 RepID=UPI00315A622E